MKYKVTITPQVGKPHSSIHGSIEAAREYAETWERHFCTYTIEEVNLSLQVMQSSEKHDWAPPREFFAELHREFRFTIDACAHDQNTLLPRYWSEQDNALTQSWSGERVFMNPPFGQEIPRFVHKAFIEAQSGAELVVCLLPARVDTKWWHAYVMQSTEVRFIKGRLTFGDAPSPAPFPCAVVVFDPSRTGATEFSTMGRFLEPAPLFQEQPA
jgi:phage N-6-adenine-methyltransferase